MGFPNAWPMCFCCGRCRPHDPPFAIDSMNCVHGHLSECEYSNSIVIVTPRWSGACLVLAFELDAGGHASGQTLRSAFAMKGHHAPCASIASISAMTKWCAAPHIRTRARWRPHQFFRVPPTRKTVFLMGAWLVLVGWLMTTYAWRAHCGYCDIRFFIHSFSLFDSFMRDMRLRRTHVRMFICS